VEGGPPKRAASSCGTRSACSVASCDRIKLQPKARTLPRANRIVGLISLQFHGTAPMIDVQAYAGVAFKLGHNRPMLFSVIRSCGRRVGNTGSHSPRNVSSPQAAFVRRLILALGLVVGIPLTARRPLHIFQSLS
jgi:hypothetical protein